MQETNRRLMLRNQVVSWGVCFLLFLHPLFLTDRYYNLTMSKSWFFICGVCLLTLIALILSFGTKRSKDFSKVEKGEAVLLAIWICMLVGAACTLLLSEYKLEALTGMDGRWLGFLFYVAVCLLFLVCRRCFLLTEPVLLAYQLSAVFVMVFALLQRCGLDLFGLLAVVPAKQRAVFLSTVGNVNVFAGFLCVSVPVSLYLLVNGRRHPVYRVAAGLGAFALLAADSDSGYIGLAAVVWLLVWTSFPAQEKLRRVCLLGAGFFAAALVYRLALVCGLIRVEVGGLSFLLTRLPVALCGLVAAALLWLLLFKKNLSARVLRRGRVAFAVGSALAVMVLGGAMVYVTVLHPALPLGGLEPYLRMNGGWGSARGEIWSACAALYGKLPALQKLFGYGQDCLYYALSDYAFDEMTRLQAVTDNAHNELLQYLVTTGAAGLAAYLAVVAVSLRRAAQQAKKDPLFGAVLFAAAGYLAQSVINISQAITTPLFFTLLILGSCRAANFAPDSACNT